MVNFPRSPAGIAAIVNEGGRISVIGEGPQLVVAPQHVGRLRLTGFALPLALGLSALGSRPAWLPPPSPSATKRNRAQNSRSRVEDCRRHSHRARRRRAGSPRGSAAGHYQVGSPP